MLIYRNTAILTKNYSLFLAFLSFFCIFACEKILFYFIILNYIIMKSLGYIGAFLGGAVAGAVLGVLMAPEKGSDTRVKITDAVEDFMKKHNIKLNRKEVGDLVDDIEDVTE